MVSLAELQRESARTNEAGGMIAFLAGALDRVAKSKNHEEAKTFAIMALQTLEEWHGGHYTPGPHDDPADWKAR
jgi:hypothetical protein